MSDFRIGVLGFIVAGEEAGRWVEVIDDQAESGGFLIFTFGDRERCGEVFDTWVESMIDVERQFDFWGWEIRWID
jgi:hypothetical protein